MIEQEELKELLENDVTLNEDSTELTAEKKELLLKLLGDAFNEGAVALEKIFSETTSISYTDIAILDKESIATKIDDTYTLVELEYSGDMYQTGVLAFEKEAEKKIVSLMLEQEIEEIGETENTTFVEAVSQMMIAYAKTLSDRTGAKFDIASKIVKESKLLARGNNVVNLTYNLKIGDKVDTKFEEIISFENVNEVFTFIKNNLEVAVPQQKQYEETSTNIQPVIFEELGMSNIAEDKENISILMDLPLQVTVQLGKTQKDIKEILKFTEGTIVELDKLAGEDVDILVNGKEIAKGEVVVVDQNFGVRITEIVSPSKRV